MCGVKCQNPSLRRVVQNYQFLIWTSLRVWEAEDSHGASGHVADVSITPRAPSSGQYFVFRLLSKLSVETFCWDCGYVWINAVRISPQKEHYGGGRWRVRLPPATCCQQNTATATAYFPIASCFLHALPRRGLLHLTLSTHSASDVCEHVWFGPV